MALGPDDLLVRLVEKAVVDKTAAGGKVVSRSRLDRIQGQLDTLLAR